MFSRFGKRSRDSATEPSPVTAQPADQSDPAGNRALGLLSLLELSNEVTARQDVFEIAEVALFNLMGHFGCSRGALWLVSDGESEDAVLARAQSVPASLGRGVGALWTRWFLERGPGIMEPTIVANAAGVDSRPAVTLAQQAELALVAPLVVRRRLVGLFALGARVGGGEFGLMELEVLRASLNVVGVAIESSTQYNRAVENNRRLRIANERLQSLDRTRTGALGGRKAELRTPLTIILACLDSLLPGESDPVRRRQLETLREQALLLHSRVVSATEVAPTGVDRGEVRAERGDVTDVLASYHQERQPGISADLRELVFSSAGEVPPAIFDPGRLVQVVDVLVENTVRSTPGGTRIQLRVEAEAAPDGTPDRVRIDVGDDGPGIPADRLPHLFDAPASGETATGAPGGPVMGLARARQLVERMGGDLTVETEIGEGTVFSLRLPAA